MKKKVFYYTDELNDDFATTVKNVKPLPKDYAYVHDTFFERLGGFIAYRIILKPFAWAYLKVRFHHKFVAPKEIKKMRSGYLLYGNHTALFADVFMPSLITFKRKNYIIAGEQASSLTALLPLLRAIGSIPLTNDRSQNREMLRCVKQRLSENASVTVFPEAHVWPYYTDIRPFTSAGFKYAAVLDAPVVCMTTCYQKRKLGKRPKAITFIDGPFYPDPALSTRENAENLRNTVYETMKKRAQEHSTYAVHEYVKKDDLKTSFS